MAEVNKISSFKSFSEVKSQENEMKIREENNLKKQETLVKIEEILDEMGLSSLSEIDEDSQQLFISKLLSGERTNEGNAFVYAAGKAKAEGKKEFEFNGKKYKVTIKDTGIKEGNAFVYAAGKAKAEGKKEFEFNGKTYKVTIKDTGIKEGNAFGDAVRKAKDAGEKEFDFEGKTYKVEENIDEAISRSAYDRMDGLHNIKSMQSLIDSAKTIFDDLSEEMFDFDEICDFIVMKIKKSKLAGMYESSLTEGKHGMAKKLLQGIIVGDSTEAEGIKMSKEMAEHFLYWINTSPFGTKNQNLPIDMLVKASYNWGIERQLPTTLKKELDALKNTVKESLDINEAAVKQFDTDFNKMVKDIKSGYGWIDPEFVADTWENSSDSIDFELVKAELYKRLIASGLLAYPNPDNEEEKGVPVRKLQELGIKESTTNEATIELDATDPKDKNLAKLLKKNNVSLEVINKKGPSGFPEVKLTGEVKDLKTVLADDEYGWDDADLEEYITESAESKAAESILDDLLGERDMEELHGMSIEDATDTVETYGHSGSKAKKIAQELVTLCNESTVTEGGFRKEGPSAAATHKAEQLKKLKALRVHTEETDRLKKAQLKRAKSSARAHEAKVTEAKDDFMARHSGTDIWLKKGYKNHTEAELQELYFKIGELVKDNLDVKQVTVLFEAKVNEAEIKSDDEFKEYAFSILKKAFGADFDEKKGQAIVDGILKKSDGDYGAAVGMITSSLGESVANEAIDAKYWEDYHEKSPKITSSSKVARAVEDEVEDWNDNNENGEENEVTPAGEKKVMNLAHDFFKATGWISGDVIQAMITQES